MLRLFPLDQRLAKDPSHALPYGVMRETGRPAGPTNTGRDQLERSEPQPFPEVFFGEMGSTHVAHFYHVADYVSSIDHWRGGDGRGRLRSVHARRPPSWDATGLVEKAWKRLDPPTRDHLAERIGLKAPTNLSKLNTGRLPMTLDYAERIARAVPSLSVADLGAPSSAVAAVDPTISDRLRSLEAEVLVLRRMVLEGFGLLGLRVELEADLGSPVVRRDLQPRRAAGAQ